MLTIIPETHPQYHYLRLYIVINRRNLMSLMLVASVTPSNHLILCRSLLLLPSHFPNIRVFSRESSLLRGWPKYWSLSFRISPSSEHSGLISLQSRGLSRASSSTIIQKHQFFGGQLSLWSSSHFHTSLQENHSFDYAELCWQGDVSAF